jgi:membrane protease YdiL (CAAX protease family)
MSRTGVVRAAVVGTVSGLAVTLVGVYAFAFLGMANASTTPEVPWAPAVAVPLLFLYWRWLGGWGWPRTTSDYRARMRRANPIPRAGRGWVIAAGLAGLVFVGAGMTLAFRLSDLPPEAFQPPPVPLWTLVPLLVMVSVVAGVCEEVGIRGYLQKPVEEAGRPVVAVLLSATVFVLLHTNKEWFLAQAAPMFLAGVWYGYYTARTDSIYPMVVVHTLIDVGAFSYFMVLGGSLPASVPQAGVTPGLWTNVALAAGALALAFACTARIPARGSVGGR